MCLKNSNITNVSLYNDHHIRLIVSRKPFKYQTICALQCENAQVEFNIVKYRKPINADNFYFIIIQNNEVKRKKDIITPNKSNKKKNV